MRRICGWWRECLKLQQQSVPDTWRTSATRGLVGACFLAEQDHAAAQPLLLQGYEWLVKHIARIPHAERAILRATATRIAENYTGLGKSVEAHAWRAKAQAHAPVTP
jgi:hypothetical protein